MSEHGTAAHFWTLCTERTYVCRAELHNDESGLRGLRTTQPVKAGQPILAVPWEITLTATVGREPAVHRIATHHLDVSHALLSAINGTHIDHRAKFWKAWSELLPPTEELPPQVGQTREYVEEQLGCRPSCEKAHWAMANIRSRPFTLPSADAASDESVFAFLPFIDMANHRGGGKANSEVRGVGTPGSNAYTAAELVALNDLNAEEVIAIDYGLESMAPSEQLEDFGFIDGVDPPPRTQPNPQPAPPSPSHIANATSYIRKQPIALVFILLVFVPSIAAFILGEFFVTRQSRGRKNRGRKSKSRLGFGRLFSPPEREAGRVGPRNFSVPRKKDN